GWLPPGRIQTRGRPTIRRALLPRRPRSTNGRNTVDGRPLSRLWPADRRPAVAPVGCHRRRGARGPGRGGGGGARVGGGTTGRQRRDAAPTRGDNETVQQPSGN